MSKAKNVDDIYASRVAIYQTRECLLEMLEGREYDVESYRDYTENDVNQMFNAYNSTKDLPTPGSLDILVKNKSGDAIFVKYYLEKFRQSTKLDKLVDDIYKTTINKTDTLILIGLGRVLLKPSKLNKVESYVNMLYSKKGYFTQIYGVENFVINPTKHIFVGKHEVISKAELKKLLTEKGMELKGMPQIRREDAVAKFIGMRPNEVCKITRMSAASISEIIYRRCSPV